MFRIPDFLEVDFPSFGKLLVFSFYSLFMLVCAVADSSLFWHDGLPPFGFVDAALALFAAVLMVSAFAFPLSAPAFEQICHTLFMFAASLFSPSISAAVLAWVLPTLCFSLVVPFVQSFYEEPSRA
jgi:hypothetical protein